MPLDKTYDPAAVQREITARWDAEKLWHAEPDERTNRFSVVIPPPNVTGALHLGHAINNTLQDILVRVHRMRGDNTVWLPGTDHAGIATQTVVDKRLQAAGEPALKEYKAMEARGENGREQFLAKVDAWKTEYEARILGQLKAMGCSCDWDRTAFTMDEPRSRAVREAFFQLFKAGLIYRGKRLVNWDPVTQTALADDEVEMEEVDGFFYYLRYPVEGTNEHVTVATTRPETMLGDTAVAINPKDPRASALRGKQVRLPIVDRLIPIIEDEYVVLPVEHGGDPADAKARMSSGFLKVTPAHDPNDYALGQKHALAMINVMAPDATISLDHGWAAMEPGQKENEALKPFLGLARELARDHIVAWFKHRGLLEKLTPYRHAVGHSYRSHAAIEPYLSDQWYCKVTDDRLAGAANRALAADQVTSGTGTADGVRFFPERYAKTYESWHNNIRDWCISRQLWWGHRIPVFTLKLNCADPKGWLEKFKYDFVVEYGGEAIFVTSATDVGTIYICGEGELDDAFLERVGAFARGERGERLKSSVKLRNPDLGMSFFETHADELKAVASCDRDQDVLDTWFSSALWPLSTLGWPEDARVSYDRIKASGRKLKDVSKIEFRDTPAAAYWNPTSVLATGRDIITLWVSRMVMFNQFLAGRIPFQHVYINPTIQDGQGQRMSKSLGNGVDPIDIIETHGADAMRFTLASMATTTQDVKLPVDLIDPHTGETFTPAFVTNNAGYVVAAPIQEHKGKRCVSSYGLASGQATPSEKMPLAKNTSAKFDLGRNFANKLWNAARFVLSQVGSEQWAVGSEGNSAARRPLPTAHSSTDRWILSQLARTIQLCNESIDSYRFDLYSKAAYDFVWRDFCDWYLEASKPAMKDPARRHATARTLSTCLDVALRLLHPMMPFITEQLWTALNETTRDRGLPGLTCPTDATNAMTAPFPAFDAGVQSLIDADAEAAIERARAIVVAIRQVRSDNKVDPKKRVPVTIRGDVALDREFVESLSVATITDVGPNAAEPADAAKTTAGNATIFVAGIIDASAGEKRKLELAKKRETMIGRLSNESYVAKAPPKLVEQSRAELAAIEAELRTLGWDG